MPTITKECLVPLTDAEIRKMCQELARLVGSLGELEEARRETARSYADEIKDIREEMKALAESIRDGHARREVLCDEVPDYAAGLMRIVRTDNGDVVATRGLTPEEMQQSLFTERVPKAQAAGAESGKKAGCPMSADAAEARMHEEMSNDPMTYEPGLE